MAELRVATLNLLNFAAPPLACYEWDNIYSQAQWQQKTNWLKALLLEQQPDILALQEVFSVTELRELLATLGYAWFAVVEQPELLDLHVFTRPVVAIASRYPLLKVAEVTADAAALAQLGLQSFQFSRKPVLVQLDTPQFGPVWLASVHLKSRRPAELPDAALALWASELQRGHEAALLRQTLALHCRSQHGQAEPLIVAGDFNDVLSSALLQPLLATDRSQQPIFLLQDAAELAAEAYRAPTHYYGAGGQVLDYLLVSTAFDPRHHHACGEVSRYRVVDRHLVSPVFARDGYSSDHAYVQISLKPSKSR